MHFMLSQNGGVIPAARRHSLLALTLAEREDISRGIACGWSIREIAKRLERAASTASLEVVARRGGRPQYRAHEADQQACDALQKIPGPVGADAFRRDLISEYGRHPDAFVKFGGRQDAYLSSTRQRLQRGAVDELFVPCFALGV